MISDFLDDSLFSQFKKLVDVKKSLFPALMIFYLSRHIQKLFYSNWGHCAGNRRADLISYMGWKVHIDLAWEIWEMRHTTSPPNTNCRRKRTDTILESTKESTNATHIFQECEKERKADLMSRENIESGAAASDMCSIQHHIEVCAKKLKVFINIGKSIFNYNWKRVGGNPSFLAVC